LLGTALISKAIKTEKGRGWQIERRFMAFVLDIKNLTLLHFVGGFMILPSKKGLNACNSMASHISRSAS
jgi:hypothetical protein